MSWEEAIEDDQQSLGKRQVTPRAVHQSGEIVIFRASDLVLLDSATERVIIGSEVEDYLRERKIDPENGWIAGQAA